jgi:hypothetical protein
MLQGGYADPDYMFPADIVRAFNSPKPRASSPEEHEEVADYNEGIITDSYVRYLVGQQWGWLGTDSKCHSGRIKVGSWPLDMRIITSEAYGFYRFSSKEEYEYVFIPTYFNTCTLLAASLFSPYAKKRPMMAVRHLPKAIADGLKFIKDYIGSGLFDSRLRYLFTVLQLYIRTAKANPYILSDTVPSGVITSIENLIVALYLQFQEEHPEQATAFFSDLEADETGIFESMIIARSDEYTQLKKLHNRPTNSEVESFREWRPYDEL